MKALLLSALLTISAFSGTVQAHGDHGAISESGAMNIATRVVQKMTLRDYGYTAGQLDTSWQSIGKDQVVLKESGENFYVVEVTKSGSDEKVYVKVLLDGSISDVSKVYPF
ncbi:MAG: hypothetical protein CMI03_09030 [Oceanospirillaceae bacterium]|uniref:DUF6488 family protein n=1 Tax=unclassified Thalassolituus TaxID=2624967 RepID=UPI000C43B4C6|nr:MULTISPECIES: DUF6488 family protein [unclassified Thalassolituus]MAS25431.1 hypothetical protein [Oceanospirillaceae bacterium]MBS52881.1 hypothetical protein [Oceanospirillaceae bacterium]|tara:strand:+ start:165 stop:497 length:333 start_codon:yes stop_codon:yes gene_type:complete